MGTEFSRVHVFICRPMPMTMEADLRGTIIAEEVRLTPTSRTGTIFTNCHCSVIGNPGKYLFVHTIFFGEVNHRLDILRLCFIEKRTIAHDETTAFAGSIDEFLAVSFHFIGCG